MASACSASDGSPRPPGSCGGGRGSRTTRPRTPPASRRCTRTGPSVAARSSCGGPPPLLSGTGSSRGERSTGCPPPPAGCETTSVWASAGRRRICGGVSRTWSGPSGSSPRRHRLRVLRVDLRGPHDLRQLHPLVRHVGCLRLPGPEDEAPRVRLRVERHLRAVRDRPDLRTHDLLHLADVLGVLVHRHGGDLVLDLDLGRDARDPRRRLHEPHPVLLRQVGLVPHVQLDRAQVRDDVRLRPSVDRPDVHGELRHVVLRAAVRLERGEDPHHLQDRVVPEVGHRAVRAPAAGRHLEPQNALLAPDDLQVRGLPDDDRRGTLDQVRPVELRRGLHRRLLVGREQERERYVRRLQVAGGGEHRGAPALHVRRAAAVQAVAVPVPRLAGPALAHRDRVEVAVERHAAVAHVGGHREEVLVHRGLEAHRLHLAHHDVEDRVEVRAGPAPCGDEAGQHVLRVLLPNHARYLRSSSLWTIAITWSAWMERGPTEHTATRLPATTASSSPVRSAVSESTNATCRGSPTSLMSFPPSRSSITGSGIDSRTSASPRRATKTPGATSRSTRETSASAPRTRPAPVRTSGPKDCRRAPTRRTAGGGSGGPSSMRVISESRRRSWDTRSAAFAAFSRRSIRPAPPARSSRGNSGDVEARWPTITKRRIPTTTPRLERALPPLIPRFGTRTSGRAA